MERWDSAVGIMPWVRKAEILCEFLHEGLQGRVAKDQPDSGDYTGLPRQGLEAILIRVTDVLGRSIAFHAACSQNGDIRVKPRDRGPSESWAGNTERRCQLAGSLVECINESLWGNVRECQ